MFEEKQKLRVEVKGEDKTEEYLAKLEKNKPKKEKDEEESDEVPEKLKGKSNGNLEYIG